MGLKPTYGRCSRAGVVTLSWTLDHTGPMARTVEDCAYQLQALAGHDPLDPASSRAPVSDYLAPLGRPIRGLAIGVPSRDFFLEGADPEVAAAFEASLATLRTLGADVRDVAIPRIWDSPSFMVILASEAFAYHERDLRERPGMYGELLRDAAAPRRALHRRGVRAGDAPARAAAPGDARRARHRGPPGDADGAEARRRRSPTAYDTSVGFPRSNMPPFNLSGLPALALPCGFTRAGLPISLQLAGRPFDEATVLRAGHAYEQATEWHTRRPPLTP